LILGIILGTLLISLFLRSFSTKNVCHREAEKEISELSKLSGLEDKQVIERLIKEAEEKCIQERRK
jgi:hypothetical protein